MVVQVLRAMSKREPSTLSCCKRLRKHVLLCVPPSPDGQHVEVRRFVQPMRAQHNVAGSWEAALRGMIFTCQWAPHSI
eukprot:4531653-Alexandrium_andersonii.AAC.1